jgi:hypothetical protein
MYSRKIGNLIVKCCHTSRQELQIMELDGLVMWYISVEHVRRMKSIWSGGSPLGMTSQGFVSGKKKKNTPCSTLC